MGKRYSHKSKGNHRDLRFIASFMFRLFCVAFSELPLRPPCIPDEFFCSPEQEGTILTCDFYGYQIDFFSLAHL